MIEVSQAFQDAWLNGNQKYIQLNFSDNTTLDDNSIVSESFSMKQALCEESQLMFGLTSSTEVSIQILNNNKQYKGLNMNILMGAVDDENHYYTMDLGTYKIENDVRSDDRLYRTLTAYDPLYNVLNNDYSEWYETLGSTFTLKQFRDAFFSHIGIVQETYTLEQDSVTLNKKPNVTSLSGKDVIQGICETSACFGFINYNGKFQYVSPTVGSGHFPSNALYPSNDFYPGDGADIVIDGSDDESAPVYGGLVYSDYYTHKITGARFVSTENTPMAGIGTGNVYQFADSVLFYNQTAPNLLSIVGRFLNQVENFFYIPSSIKARARVWAQLGDMLIVQAGENSVLMPVLERQMDGITALYDTYTAKGSEYYLYSANSITTRMTDAESRIGESESRIDDNESRIDDAEDEIADLDEKIDGVEISLKRTVDGLESRVAKSQREWDTTGYNIYEYGYEAPTNSEYPPSEYSGKYYLNQTNGALYYCNGSSWSYYTSFQTIQASLESDISQTADQISLKVSKGDVSSQLSIESGQITLSSGRLVITAGNFTLDAAGNAAATNFIAKRWVQIDSGSSGYVYLGGGSGGKLAILSNVSAMGNDGWVGSYGGVQCGDISCVGNITLDPGCHVYEYASNYSLQQYATQTWVSDNFASDLELSSVQTVAGDAYNNANTAIADAYNAQTQANNAYTLASNALKGVRGAGRESGTGKYFLHTLYDSSGTVYYTTMEIDTGSDRRLKVDIKPLDDFTDFYMELKVYKFKYNPKLEATRMRDYVHYGIMAQDTMELYDKYGIPSEDISLFYKEEADEVQKELTGEDTYWSMNRGELHALHIQMIQKQQRQIDAQQKEIDSLKAELNELKCLVMDCIGKEK